MIYYCVFCGKRLDRKKKKYCSNSCKCKYFYKQHPEKCNKWRKSKVNNKCITCGKTCGRKKYCSNECKPQRINIPSYWKGIEIFNIHCYVCQGLIFKVHIHHKDGNHDNNEQNNLIPLCPSCHKKVHTPKLNNFRYFGNMNLPIELKLKELRNFLFCKTIL